MAKITIGAALASSLFVGCISFSWILLHTTTQVDALVSPAARTGRSITVSSSPEGKRADHFLNGGCFQRRVGLRHETSSSVVDRVFLLLAAAPNGQEERIRPGSLAAATAETGRVPYGESSRKYRRTVFDQGDWINHRSETRLASNIKGLFFSGIVRQLKSEVFLISAIAVSVLLWNDVLVPASLVPLPVLALPALPFTLSSPALGLLLVFRTNASYGRWMEARATWAKISTQSGNIVRMSCTFMPNEEASTTNTASNRQALDRLVRATWVLPRSLMNRLLGPEDNLPYEEELTLAFQEDDPSCILPQLLSAPTEDRPVVALMELSMAVDAMPIDEKRCVEIDKSIVIIGDCIGVCERIFTTPVPLVYTRHTARFLILWLLLLPLALYDTFATTNTVQPNAWLHLYGLGLIPSVALMSLFLFGIEELAVQLEEPFSILPMNNFCDGIQQATTRMRDWKVQNDAQQNPIPLDQQKHEQQRIEG